MAQLALDEKWTVVFHPQVRRFRQAARRCVHCRAREARYGFRNDDDGDPRASRQRTLCFECFRVEIGRRQGLAASGLGWTPAHQARLPLEQTLESLNRRRRRAQIAARHALAAGDSR